MRSSPGRRSTTRSMFIDFLTRHFRTKRDLLAALQPYLLQRARIDTPLSLGVRVLDPWAAG